MPVTNDIPSFDVLTFDIQNASFYFRVVNHTLRQQMLLLLHAKGEMKVTDIYLDLAMDQSVVSRHLAFLRKARLVQTTKEGKNIFYSVNYAQLARIHELAGQLLK